jgi:hypothetical protein
MYVQQIGLNSTSRVLHFAPEQGLYAKISQIVAPGNYCVADIDPGRFTFAPDARRMDLCDLDELPENHFDLILHSHVMEHIPCNVAYTLFHLHRGLKPDGHHVCVIPFLPGSYDECFADIGDAERVRRFGQNDHVRRFGRDDVDRHLGSVLDFDRDFDATRDFEPSALLEANIPESTWRGLTVHTVLKLRKKDMRLLRN